MKSETNTEMNLMFMQIGMKVTDVYIDPNNEDLIVDFDRAGFGYHCEYEFIPADLQPLQLVGAILTNILVEESIMTYLFDSGCQIRFYLDKCSCIEIFSGSIIKENGEQLFISSEL